MNLEFAKECPTCLEENKIISKCKICKNWCCNLCSHSKENIICNNCFIDKNKDIEVHLYFYDKNTIVRKYEI